MRTAKNIIGIAIAAALAFSVSDAFAKGWGTRAMPWAKRNAAFGTYAAKSGLARWAKRNTSFEVVDAKTLGGQERQIYDSMVNVLKANATPGLGMILEDPGNGVRAAVTRGGGNCGSGQWPAIELSGLRGGKVNALIFCPTSGHTGQAVEFGKNQQHTLWINQNKNYTPGSGTPLVRGQQTNPAQDNGFVTVVRVKDIPMQPGTNFLMFDPFPGRTAGVGGFPEGRIVEFNVK